MLMVHPVASGPWDRRCPFRFLLLLLLLLFTSMTIGPVAVEAQEPSPLTALCDSARAHLERGDIEGARALYERVLTRDQDYPPAVLGMGMTLLEIPRQTLRALEYLHQATSLMPTDPQAHFQRARAHLILADTDLGRDNAGEARRELETVIALDPSHGEAYYLLGTLYMEVYRDYEQAAAAFRRQTEANPGKLEARYEYVRALMDMGMFADAVKEAEALRRRAPDDPRIYPYLAGAYWKQGRAEEAMRVFEDYFSRLEPRERDLYFDLGLVITASEAREFEGLSAEGRRSWWNHYWSIRDPDPKTAVNERLLEHFVRVAWARLEFGRKIWPWDARGAFYVRYGEPDLRSARSKPIAWALVEDDPQFLSAKSNLNRRMGLSSLYDPFSPFNADHFEPPIDIPKYLVIDIANEMQASGIEGTLDDIWSVACSEAEFKYPNLAIISTPERWIYLSHGIDVAFMDPVNSGRYLVEGPRSRMLVEQMEVRLPTISEEEEKIVMVDPMDGVFTFRGTAGKTAVEYAFALLPDEFGAFRSVTGVYATLDVDVRVYTPQWEEVARAGEGAKRLQTVPQVTIRGIPLFVDATRLEVAPGDYRIATLLLDPGSGRRATAEEMVTVPDYSGGALQVSDILPAASIKEVPRGTEGRFVRGNLEVLPLPGRALQSDQPLFIYYEIYNLTKDPIGATDYEVSYAVGEAADEEGLGSRLFQGLKSLVGAGRRRSVLTARVERNGITTDSGEYLQIDMSAVPAGTWLLELTVTDRQTGQSASQRLLFRTFPVR
jgi:GWxTD domain-containing protein